MTTSYGNSISTYLNSSLNTSSLSGVTIKSTIDVQADLITRLDQRLSQLENKFHDMQDFLDYKGITKQEFEDFLESRRLAEKMVRDQRYEFPYMKFDVKVTPIVPVDHIEFTYSFDVDDELDKK